MGFEIVDITTGEYPNLREIALHEPWASGLLYCDMDGFLLYEDGSLAITDDCDRLAFCPHGRFEVTINLPQNKGSYSYIY